MDSSIWRATRRRRSARGGRSSGSRDEAGAPRHPGLPTLQGVARPSHGRRGRNRGARGHPALPDVRPQLPDHRRDSPLRGERVVCGELRPAVALVPPRAARLPERQRRVGAHARGHDGLDRGGLPRPPGAGRRRRRGALRRGRREQGRRGGRRGSEPRRRRGVREHRPTSQCPPRAGRHHGHALSRWHLRSRVLRRRAAPHARSRARLRPRGRRGPQGRRTRRLRVRALWSESPVLRRDPAVDDAAAAPRAARRVGACRSRLLPLSRAR